MSRGFQYGLLLVVLSGCSSSSGNESRWNYNRGGPPSESTPEYVDRGDFLIFDVVREGKGHIFRYDIPNHKQVQLTPDEFCDFAPIVSDDSEQMAFTRRAKGYQHIYIQKLSTKESSYPATTGRVLDTPLRFSSDNKSLYFLRTTWAGGRLLLPRRHLYRIDAPFTNSNPQLLRNDAFDVSSEERNFVLKAGHSRGPVFSLVDSDGRALLTQDGFSPRLSPQGDKISWVEAFERGERIMFVEDPANQRVVKAALPFGVCTSPRFSATGKWIVYRVLRSENGAEPKIVILHSPDLAIFKEIPLDSER